MSRGKNMSLSSQEKLRYHRHLVLPEIGLEGQLRLQQSRVLLVGAGGLGSPIAMYLAAAGVGTLGIVDADSVDVTNLQRQLLHRSANVGRPKVDSAVETLMEINPHICVIPIADRFSAGNALSLVADFDLVIDGTDNFPSRYLLNDVCMLQRKSLVHGAISQFSGQVTVFDAGHGPCYRCLFPDPPEERGNIEIGVMGVLPGVIGVIQATEAIKLLLKIGDLLVGRLLMYDALAMRFREVHVEKNPECPLCGKAPSITSLVEYEPKCDVAAPSV